MDLTELITHCRSLLNEPAPRLFTNVELTRWLNLGLKDFVNKTLPCENVKAYAAVANQARYAKPSNAILMEEMLWEERYVIDPKDIKEFRKAMWINPTVRGSIPLMYSEYPGFNNPEFQLWPITNTASQSSTLTAGITSSATTIPVVSTTGFPTSGWILIDSEQIWYNNTDATNFLQCERGKGGTTAAAHLAAATVSWGQLTIRYVYDPPLLVNGGDTPPFIAAWHEALALYSSKIGFEKMGKIQEANMLMGQYQRFIEQANNTRQSRSYDTPSFWTGWENDVNFY